MTTKSGPDIIYLPTPDIIAAECAKIRAGWSKEERHVRLVGPPRLPVMRGEPAPSDDEVAG